MDTRLCNYLKDEIINIQTVAGKTTTTTAISVGTNLQTSETEQTNSDVSKLANTSFKNFNNFNPGLFSGKATILIFNDNKAISSKLLSFGAKLMYLFDKFFVRGDYKAAAEETYNERKAALKNNYADMPEEVKLAFIALDKSFARYDNLTETKGYFPKGRTLKKPNEGKIEKKQEKTIKQIMKEGEKAAIKFGHETGVSGMGESLEQPKWHDVKLGQLEAIELEKKFKKGETKIGGIEPEAPARSQSAKQHHSEVVENKEKVVQSQNVIKEPARSTSVQPQRNKEIE